MAKRRQTWTNFRNFLLLN